LIRPAGRPCSAKHGRGLLRERVSSEQRDQEAFQHRTSVVVSGFSRTVAPETTRIVAKVRLAAAYGKHQSRGWQMDLGLNEKRALVTGSTAGIGLSIARALVHEGAHVTINGRTEARVR